MLKVRSTEEALVLAKEMCSRHHDLIQGIGPSKTARDIAMAILLEELQTGEPIAKQVQQSNIGQQQAYPFSAGGGGGAGFNGGGGTDTAPTSPTSGRNVRGCPYCSEPTSRYCKETGRRHQNAEERALLYWKRCYRQFALASQFVSSARLAKKNTCVEDYAVELDF
ncbi:Hypothetical protein, putative [Bodo saltans]|uniref:Uncharacterized protein n=1 Tax=Bodo saltans TaxID=75058 RepID=A0A0S4J6W2_BODSA|nr:Hypothetical protein, putative [Bodo saltans]|eukprot:CUG85644.1 Hypothetical protein, putative [Bodo saltans]